VLVVWSRHRRRPKAANPGVAGVAVLAVLAGAAVGLPASPAAAAGPPAPIPTTTVPITTVPSPTTTVPAPGSTTTAPPGTSTTMPPAAPPVDETALRADQVAVVTGDHQPAIDGASRRLAADGTAMADDQTTLATDRAAVASDAAGMVADRSAVAADAADLGRALTAHGAAVAALAGDRRRLRGVAVVLYEGLPDSATTLTSTPEPTPNLVDAQNEAAYAALLVDDAVVAIDGHVGADLAATDTTAAQVRRLRTAVVAGRRAVAREQAAAAAAAAGVATSAAALGAITTRLAGDQAAVAAARTALARAVAALAGTLPRPPAPGDSSPSILGPSALDAAQLVAWFGTSGYIDLTATPIGQLAQWYIDEGSREGVRGDIAFAQAVLETGGFSSPDAVTLNNYAGIGHCDSCAAGWAFPSPQLGVRGQIQLLRAYAQPGLTAAQLADPPAITGVTPEKQGVRGCCDTWQSLTGVWATNPIYGPVILDLYQSMLGSALGRRSASG
jgi:hypothetical protein